MKRSTKRVVGWGTGVSVGVVLILLACILVIATGDAPEKHVNADQMASVDEVVLEEPVAQIEKR